jgi:preprotein translocase subunit SecD
MKKISYSVIAIFLFCLVAMSFTHKSSRTILLQTNDDSVTKVSLNLSAEIISNRLKDLNSENFDVTVITKKNQIQITLTDNRDMKLIESLITKKGKFEFYETLNRNSLSEIIKDDDKLFSLFNAGDTIEKVGCAPISEVGKINDYLRALDLSTKYKFAWNDYSNDSVACLYALKTSGEKTALFNYSDIDNIKFDVDKSSKNNEIDIAFKKSSVKLLADATKSNIGNAIAIVIDDNVISAPVVRSEIDDGHCTITGNFTQDEAKYIAALGNNGELPLNFKVVK